MTGASWVTLVLLALALAVQPWSVLAAVLLVASENGIRKEVAYVIGWFLALLVIAAAVLILYPAKPKQTSTSPVLSAIELGAGIVLAGWVLLRWRRGAPEGTPDAASGSQQPRWMGRIDTMSPVLALVFGAFLPNYVLVVAAVTNILELGVSKSTAAVVSFVWVVVASLGVAAPLIVLLVRRDQAAGIYEGWRAWLLKNGQSLVLAVLGVVGVALVVKGVVGLLT